MVYEKVNPIILLVPFTVITVNSQGAYKVKKVLFKDNFSAALNDNWAIEKLKADSEVVTINNGKLLLDTYNGATVWYKKELKGILSSS